MESWLGINFLHREEEKEINYDEDEGKDPEIEEEEFNLEEIISKNIKNQLQKLNDEEENKTNKNEINKKIDEKEQKNLKEKRDEFLMIREEQGKFF